MTGLAPEPVDRSIARILAGGLDTPLTDHNDQEPAPSAPPHSSTAPTRPGNPCPPTGPRDSAT